MVLCYHCGHQLEVAARALTTSCPGCFKALQVADIIVKTMQAVRKIQTCGRLVVEKTGRVFAQSVEAQEGVEVDGILEASVVSRGPVRIGPKATWKGDCRAPLLRVDLGSTIVGGKFVVPDATLRTSISKDT